MTKLRGFLGRQPLVLLTAAVVGWTVAAHSLPYFGSDLVPTDLVRGVSPLLLLLALFSAFGSGSFVETLQERHFWRLLGAGFALWTGLEWGRKLAPPDADSVFLIADCLYLAVFLLCILAAEEVPKSSPLAGPSAPELGMIRRLGMVVFAFGVLAYFVVIPNWFHPGAYHGLLPSYLLYSVLDFLVVVHFVRAAQRSRCPRMRRVCRLFLLAFLGWGVIDGLDAFGRWSGSLVAPGTMLDLLWFVPFLLVAVAFHLRRYRSADDLALQTGILVGLPTSPPTWRSQVVLIALPFLLPVFHLVGYGLGSLDGASRNARELTVLLFALTMAGVALANVVLHSAVRRLEHSQRLAALGRLAGGVAHDFNNLLTVISGHGGLLLDELPVGHRGRRSAEEIGQAARRASDLTRQLLSFASQQRHEPRAVDLNELVRELRTMLQRLLGERVRLDLELAPRIRPISADPGQLEQVILNLVVNASDAMAAGGVVTVTTADVDVPPSAPTTGDAPPPGCWVRLSVVDRGCGIEEATLGKIFEPFFTSKAPGRGTGLGLSTVFGIVSQYGGHIRVESVLGQGTRFEVGFPCLVGDSLPSPVAALPVVDPTPQTAATVLLVEDEPAVALVARLVLEHAGYRVLEARDGEEALGLFAAAEVPVDLLITDVVMPGLSGPELAVRILEQRPELPVLFVTGYSTDELWADRPLTGHSVLTKPFSPDQLARRVEELLDRPPVASRRSAPT